MATHIKLPDYEQLERAFSEARKTVELLPETIRTRTPRSRAVDHLEMAEQYAYEARERSKIGDADDG